MKNDMLRTFIELQVRGVSGDSLEPGRKGGAGRLLSQSRYMLIGAQPELFADLDPRATLTAINERFLAVPYRGDYWTDLVPA